MPGRHAGRLPGVGGERRAASAAHREERHGRKGAGAEGRGVRVYGLSESMVEEAPDSRTVLLGFGGLKSEEIREGVALLREAWKGKG